MHNSAAYNQAGLQDRKHLKIISVDGGGVRGIIPARLIQEIETRTDKHTTELFSIASGTSTGGIVVLGLSTPTPQGTPKLGGKDLVDIYLTDSSRIFSKSAIRNIVTGFGLWGAKYDRNNLDSILADTFGNLTLSQTLFNVYVPIYSIANDKPYIASTKDALQSDEANFYVRDIAGATSAAPTYFAPKVINNLTRSLSYTTADGGLYANDPELVAALSALSLLPKMDISQVTLVSIGTGEDEMPASKVEGNNGIVGWLKDKSLVNSMIDAEAALDDQLASNLFKSNRYRLQVALPDKMMAMDNSDSDNLTSLLAMAENYIKNNTRIIDEICGKLT